MGKLYFKYGAMGSSKTASALMCRFNYMQKGMKVLLLKPQIDTRFKANEVVSRIGLSAPCITFADNENLLDLFEEQNDNEALDIVIVDECQFCTKQQIEQLRAITDKVSVLCYGLMTNYKGELFEGSKRLVEICDSLSEIKSVCECGRKATMNAKFVKGIISVEGKEIDIGADEKYKGMCYSCFKREQQKAKVYNKILSHIKNIKACKDAGTWSTDTAAGNIVVDKPYVIYDDEVKSFVRDFREFEIKKPETIVDINATVETLAPLCVCDKNFEYMIALISLVLKEEKNKPGLLKALIETDILTNWLKRIKKIVDNLDD